MSDKDQATIEDVERGVDAIRVRSNIKGNPDCKIVEKTRLSRESYWIIDSTHWILPGESSRDQWKIRQTNFHLGGVTHLFNLQSKSMHECILNAQ